MSPISHSAGHGALRMRIRWLLTAALAVGALALLQRTSLALFPHAADDFLGGLAVGLAASTAIGWLSTRA